MKSLKIAVAGCGPAGLAAALMLHGGGHSVTLFERFDTPQPIGSGLIIQPTGLAVLRQLGLESAILAHGMKIDRLLGKTGPGRTVLDVRYQSLGHGAHFGVGIHRATLFTILYDAVAANKIPVMTGRAISGSVMVGRQRAITFGDGSSSGPFDLIVDALGTKTTLAPVEGRELAYGALWATLDWPNGLDFMPNALEQRYRAASRMVGVLPIGTSTTDIQQKAAFFWSLRADHLQCWQAAGLAAWKHEVLALWPALDPLLVQIHSADQLTFAHYSHRTLQRPAEPRLIHIGDAWHSASPQLGQGANMALLDAYALALGLRQQSNIDAAIAKAVSLRRSHVLLYQGLTAFFTPVYQSDSRWIPIIRDRLVGPLSKLWPATWIQTAIVSGLIGNPLRKLGLRSNHNREVTTSAGPRSLP